MINKGFIFAVLLALTRVQSAYADTACQTVDNVLHSLALVQTLQDDPQAMFNTDSLFKLRSLADDMSLSVLITVESRDMFPKESDEILNYLGAIRSATSDLASAAGGAQDTIQTYSVPNVARSIQAMTTYWDCHSKDLPPRTQKDTLSKVTSFTEAPVGEFGGESGSAHSSSDKKSNSRNPAINNVVIDRGNRDIAPILKQYSKSFYAITFLMIVAAIYYFHKRSKRFRIRENRRIIHKPAMARIRRTDHDIIIVDISMNGLKIRHPDMLQTHRKLRLKIDGTWYAAHIMWSNKLFAGVRFHRPISSTAFQSITR